MLKLRFRQPDLDDPDDDFIEMPIDYKQKHRHWNPDKHIIKKKVY